MTAMVQHTWQLECWGPGWAWMGCEGASEGWGNVSLVPLKQRAVEVTWVWPDWSATSGLPGVQTPKTTPTDILVPPTIAPLATPTEANIITPAQTVFTPADTIRYQVEYGPLNAPFLLGRVGGNSRGVTLEEGVEPWTTYEVKLTTDAMANTSAIFFHIKEVVSEVSSGGGVRAEEVTLVVLVLMLWLVAILLFFHRWGKIRMLEPYQPEYKPMTHAPACPLAPTTTPPQPPPPRPPNPRPILPRKSSSLCFTPSMLRAANVPKSCRISVPQIDQTPVHRCVRASHHSPGSYAHHGRHRLRLASESLDQSSYGCNMIQQEVQVSRKVRSAENLRHYRPTITTGRSVDEGCRGGNQHLGEDLKHPALARRSSCQTQSLDLEHYRAATPLLQDVAPRGRSLDSTSVSSLRRSPTAGPSWAGGGEPVCTTPELRVSPTPTTDTTPTTHHNHNVVLQRQETIDDTLLAVPYATLMEEEVENEF